VANRIAPPLQSLTLPLRPVRIYAVFRRPERGDFLTCESDNMGAAGLGKEDGMKCRLRPPSAARMSAPAEPSATRLPVR
jgi:hypothetical protein